MFNVYVRLEKMIHWKEYFVPIHIFLVQEEQYLIYYLHTDAKLPLLSQSMELDISKAIEVAKVANKYIN